MKLKITVHGVAYEVDVEVLDASDEMQGQPAPLPVMSAPAPGPGAVQAPGPRPAAGPAPVAPGSGSVGSPIAGTVLEVKCQVGAEVTQGQTLLIIEAMKMETAIAAPEAGTIKTVHVAAGDAVRENQVLVDFA